MPSSKTQLISVIVPCRNEAGHIAGFLDRLLAQQLPAGTQMEVLIADGMSQDGTCDVIDRFSAQHPLLGPLKISRTGVSAMERLDSKPEVKAEE